MTDDAGPELSGSQRTRPSGDLTKGTYAIIFLVLSSHYFERFVVRYMSGLVQQDRIGLWTWLIEYLDTGASVFLVLQMLAVVLFYRFGKTRICFQDFGLRSKQTPIRNACYGILAGLAVFVAGLPLLLALDRHVGFVSLLTGDFFRVRSVLLVILLAVVVPISTEVAFRGIILRSLLRNTSLSAAVLVSSLVFAYVWPLYNAGIGFLLGVASALLYNRFNSLLPGIVANMVVTISCGATLFCKELLR